MPSLYKTTKTAFRNNPFGLFEKIFEGSSLNPYRVKAVFLGFMIDFGHRRIQMEKQSPQLRDLHQVFCRDTCE